MKIIRKTLTGISLTVLALALTGCVDLKQKTQPVTYHNLDYAAPTAAATKSPSVTLKVRRFSATPPFNSARIIYQPEPRVQQHYVLHHWREAPATMATALLRRDLTETNSFRAVLDSYSRLSGEYDISGVVETCQEINTAKGWEAHWALTITVSTSVTSIRFPNGLVMQKRYTAVTPIDVKSPQGTVKALSAGFESISKQVYADVLAATKPAAAKEDK